MLKNLSKLIGAFGLVIAFANTSSAQTTATETFTANATIVKPISISNKSTLEFGVIATSPASGTVTIGTDGSRSAQNGAKIFGTTGSVAAASFTVQGEGGYGYNITLPADGTVNLVGPAQSAPMSINGFTCNATGVINATTGKEDAKVGAVLTVNANQSSGVYTGTFNVTVNYN